MPLINSIISKYPNVYDSLPRDEYLKLLESVDVIIGNSSSGILEAPGRTATINIGERQDGRIRSESIIDCDSDIMSIRNAIEILNSVDFQEKLKETKNKFYNRDAARRIKEILKLWQPKTKKQFYDNRKSITDIR